MKQYMVAAAILVVMMAFQNCGQAPGSNAFSTGSNEIPANQMTKIKADQFTSVVMTDADKARFLEVDIASGKVNGFDDRGISTGDHFCIGERDRAQLEDLLKAAEVCEPAAAAPQGENCMMVYKYPYAQLKNSSHEVNLGEKHNGCEVPADLCGDRAVHLKSLVDSLVKRVDHMACE